MCIIEEWTIVSVTGSISSFSRG